MRIVVCVKHIPDVQSERRIEDGRVVRGEDDVLNELDENAIEEAVSLVEEHGGKVIALTMGPEDAHDALLRALQMGADRGVLVSDDRLEGSDAIGTAAVLAAAIRTIGEGGGGEPIDAVFTGMASLDGMTSMMPAALAAELHVPFLGMAYSLSVLPAPEGAAPSESAPVFTIERSADGFDDSLRARGPVVVSVTDQINEPRYPSFKTMKAARSKPVDEWSLDDLVAQQGDVDLLGPLSAISVLAATEKTRAGSGTIVTDSGDGGRKLAEYLINEVNAK